MAEPEPGALQSPKSRPSRQRRRGKHQAHVTWDEQCIAEHDKERGTRQKIDEPDTPFIRSPQTGSDSEGGPASSDDAHEQRPVVCHGLDMASFAAMVSSGAAGAAAAATAAHSRQAEVEPGAVAEKLNDWVQSKSGWDRAESERTGSSDCGDAAYAGDVEHSRPSSTCSSRSSSSAPQHRQGALGEDAKKHSERSGERRISLPEDEPAPKLVSASFKAKRAEHYNEVAALKAFKSRAGGTGSGNSSPESDGSEEGEDAAAPSSVSTVVTNTNTNVNQAATSSSSVLCETLQRRRNSKEKEADRGEPPARGEEKRLSDSVTFNVESLAESPGSGSPTSPAAQRGADRDVSAWSAKRKAHYGKEGNALRSMPPPSDDEESSTSEEGGS